MREAKKSKSEEIVSGVKKKISGYIKNPDPKKFIAPAAVVIALAIGSASIGAAAYKNETRMDYAAEAYANTMSRSELSMITSGYSPAEDEVISDVYENQRNDANELIRNIAGLEGLYDLDHSQVTYENYADLAEDYMAYVKEFAWNNVGQYRFSNYEQRNCYIYQKVDRSDGEVGTYIAVGAGDYSNNTFATSLRPEDKCYVGNTKYMEQLLNNYVQVMSAMDAHDYTALRKSLGRSISIINNVSNQMYYIGEDGVLNEVPVLDAQEQLLDEVAQNDYRIIDDGSGNTTVVLTDIHPDDDRDER